MEWDEFNARQDRFDRRLHKQRNRGISHFLLPYVENDLERAERSVKDDVHLRGIFNWNRNVTPLWVSCKFGHLELARMLVEVGAEIEATDHLGSTCLMAACSSCNLDLVKYLVGLGADINAKTLSGNTALHHASASDPECLIMDYLLSLKAVVTRNHGAKSPFMSVALQGETDLVETYIELINKHEHVDKSEQVNCLFLVGCCFVYKRAFATGVSMWKRAISTIQRLHTQGFSYEYVTRPLPVEFDGIQEMMTSVELDDMMEMMEDAMMNMQAFLIRYRILGLYDSRVSDFLIDRAAALFDSDNVLGALSLWRFVLEHTPVNVSNINGIQNDIMRFATFLTHVFDLRNKAPTRHHHQQALVYFKCCDLELGMRKTFDLYKFYRDNKQTCDQASSSQSVPETCIRVIVQYVLLSTEAGFNSEDGVIALTRAMIAYPVLDNQHETILHTLFASDISRWFISRHILHFVSPSLPALQFLIDCGADVNAPCQKSYTPLAYFLKEEGRVRMAPSASDEEAAVVTQLVDFFYRNGADLTLYASIRKSPLDLCGSFLQSQGVSLVSYTSLKCLAAVQVKRSEDVLDLSELPTTLLNFVQRH